MKFLLSVMVWGLLVFGLTSCAEKTPAQPRVYADTFFSGCAYLDANRNEVLDDGDTPVKNAAFSIRLQLGAGFGDKTGESGCASVIIPAGLSEKFYPVEARMTPPDSEALISLTKQPVLIQHGETGAKFLFRKK